VPAQDFFRAKQTADTADLGRQSPGSNKYAVTFAGIASPTKIPSGYFSGIDQGGDAVTREHLAIAFKASAKFGAALRILRAKARVIRGARVPDSLRICIGRCARTEHHYASEDCEAESIEKLNHGILSSDWNFE
jgi:hypothetical protein